MRRALILSLALAATVTGFTLAPNSGRAGVFDRLWSEPTPPTLTDVARMIDHIQEPLLNQGTVVIKQPDIWSQARMTMFRKEFEDTMSLELTKFQEKLAARIARSDAASFQSQTALGAVLTPFGNTAAGTPFTPAITSQDQLNTALTSTMGLVTTPAPAGSPPGTGSAIATPPIPAPNTTPAATFSLLNQVSGGTGALAPPTGMNFGLEPNVHLDEEADYITHLHRLRRINLGDDTADSAGYGLYLMRVPVSIQPGDITKKGWGAIVNLTVRHDFGPKFLPATYRNLVINDLVDQLTPPIHELIRSGVAQSALRDTQAANAAALAAARAGRVVAQRSPALDRSVRRVAQAAEPAPFSGPRSRAYQWLHSASASHRMGMQPESNPPPLPHEMKQGAPIPWKMDAVDEAAKGKGRPKGISPFGPRDFGIAPSDLSRVLLPENLLMLAMETEVGIGFGDPNATPGGRPGDIKNARMTDVRAYLRHELEAAYDLMEGRCREQAPLLQDVRYIEDLADQVYCRKFEGPKGEPPPEPIDDFTTLYESFTNRLPGNLRDRPIGALCWGIAVEAGLLNRQLQEDMKQTKGPEGWMAPPEAEAMAFYLPQPPPEVEQVFEDYVKARWPVVTFALEPVVDQQNIEDAFTRRRDLQLAIAFALSAGRISFRQAIQFTRQLQYEAQTIALNQTVAAFANGNDTFGWRITPRYQTPPEESNLRAVTNMLIRGGPGPNWMLDNSKIEPGLRELTAVIVMPSFLRGIRIDAASNWFRLHDPDERKVHTARAVEIGRKINETRDCLETACQCAKYRPEDIERLRVRLHQLETMLPLQTAFVKVPYENTLGGFALFTQGATALVPELVGFEGVDTLDVSKGADVVVYGKHFSIYETAVIAGGVSLPREGTAGVVLKDSTGAPVSVVNNISPLRSADGKSLLVFTRDGTALPVQDNGSYNILSREVMRVRIPPNVQMATRGDGSTVVEIYVSTPTGISNRLQIPAHSPTALAAAAAGYTLSGNQLAVVYEYDASVLGSPPALSQKSVQLGNSSATMLDIQPKVVTAATPAQVTVTFTFPQGPAIALGPINFDPDKNAYHVDLKTLADKLKDIAAKFAPPNGSPGIATRSITLQPVVAQQGIVLLNGATDTQLGVTINFQAKAGTTPNPHATSAGAAAANALDAPASGAPPAPSPAIAPPFAPDPPLRPAPPGPPPTVPPAEAPKGAFRGARRALADPGLRTVGFEEPAPAATHSRIGSVGGRVALQDPDVVPSPRIVMEGPTEAPVVSPGTTPVTAAGPPTQVSVTVPSPTPVPATPSASQTVVVVPQRAPNVNVNVPITNTHPPQTHHGLFHRNRGTTPPNASPYLNARGPLMERILGRP